MHKISLTSILAVTVLLVGCGGGGTSKSNPPLSPPSLTGNWQALSTSSVTTGQQTTIVGSISQNGNQVSGMLTLFSSCFGDIMGMFTGTLQNTSLTLKSNSIDAQVVTITGTTVANGNSITGNYSVQGGCANGDEGSFSGNKIPALDGNWTGQFADANGLTFNLAQTTPDPNTGFYSIAGSSASSSATQCFAGSITGTIAGTNVDMTITSGDILTEPDQLDFQGTINIAGTAMTGSYTGLSGHCAGMSGTAGLNRQ